MVGSLPEVMQFLDEHPIGGKIFWVKELVSAADVEMRVVVNEALMAATGGGLNGNDTSERADDNTANTEAGEAGESEHSDSEVRDAVDSRPSAFGDDRAGGPGGALGELGEVGEAELLALLEAD